MNNNIKTKQSKPISMKTTKVVQTGLDVVLEGTKVVLTPVIVNQVYKKLDDMESTGARIAISCGAGILTYVCIELTRRAIVNGLEMQIQKAYDQEKAIERFENLILDDSYKYMPSQYHQHNQCSGMPMNTVGYQQPVNYTQYSQNVTQNPNPQEVSQTQASEQTAVDAFNQDVVLQPTKPNTDETNAVV